MSAKPLLLLLADQVVPARVSQLMGAVVAQGWELLLMGEGRGEKGLCRERLGLS